MKRVAVLLASSLLVFGLAEAGLRIAGYDPVSRIADESRFVIQESPDPALVYEFAPDVSGELWGTMVRINSGGFRDDEVPLEKPPGTKRVIALGDSVTFGPMLETTERWSDVLEATWRKHGIKVDVLNLGVPGYDVGQEVRFLETKGLPYDPDEVIVCFCINDVETVSFDFETITTLKRFKSGILSWSRAAQWITLALDRTRQMGDMGKIRDAERIAAAQRRITPDPVLEEKIAALRASVERTGEPEEFVVRRYRDRLLLLAEPGRLQLVRDAYERLARLSEEHGFGVTVFVAPVLFEGPHAEGWRMAYDIVRHLAESAGFEFVDVYDEVKRHGLDNLHVKPNDYVHLNRVAHFEMARAILKETRGWFP